MNLSRIFLPILFFIVLIVGIMWLAGAPEFVTGIGWAPITIVGSLILYTLYPIFTRRKIEKILQEEGIEFPNVNIVFNPVAEALKVASVGTIFIFVLIAGVLIVFFAFTPSQLPDLADLFSLALWIGGGSIVLFALFFISSFINGGNTYQSYSGLGAAYDSSHPASGILVAKEGIRGLLSIDWNTISPVISVNEMRVKLVTLRQPLWLFNAVGANDLTLAFASPEDAQKFKSLVQEHVVK